MDYYTAVKTTVLHTAVPMTLTVRVLSKSCPLQMSTYCMIPLTQRKKMEQAELILEDESFSLQRGGSD